jgi:hypothetical protein
LFRLASCAALISLTPLAGQAHWSGHRRWTGHHRSWRRHAPRLRWTERWRDPDQWMWTCERDARLDPNGEVRRCRAARDAFERENPCPSTWLTRGPCPGYVVDHIVPLKRGGADDPSNMQWQSTADARAKDKVE